MKVYGLDHKEYIWNIVGREPSCSDSKPRSQLHLRARKLLSSLYPSEKLLEEVPLPGSNGLIGDFYLPLRNKMIEIHGEQHYKFVPYFHGTKIGYMNACRRDKNKQKWCNLNNIELVILPYTGTDDEWRTKLDN